MQNNLNEENEIKYNKLPIIPILRNSSKETFDDAIKITNSETIEMYTKYEIIVSIQLPSVISYLQLNLYPSIKFDKNLLPLIDENESEFQNDKFSYPIPKFIGFLWIRLRNKFDDDLKNNICFLESSKFPDRKEIGRLAKLCYHNCESLKFIELLTDKTNTLLLFCVLLELLQLFENCLIQFSEKTAKFIERNEIFQPCKPLDFIIEEKLADQCTKYLNTQLREQCQNYKNNINDIINFYYNPIELTKLEQNNLRSTFQILIYNDLKSVKTKFQRYLMKFVLRFCLYIIRRYIIVKNCQMKKDIGMYKSYEYCSLQKHYQTFASTRMSQYLAGTITEILNNDDMYPTKLKILKNLFMLNQEDLFRLN